MRISESHDPLRKRFLARVLGLAALGAVAPGALAAAAAPTNKADGKAVAFRIRPQPRAVARGDGAA
jgi:hypothetical protein